MVAQFILKSPMKTTSSFTNSVLLLKFSQKRLEVLVHCYLTYSDLLENGEYSEGDAGPTRNCRTVA
jgi:hypothetical protein